MPDARKWSVATEWHPQQSPAVRDSRLTLPLLASLRDPAIAPHQALRPPVSFTPTHTHRHGHIACWATARGGVGGVGGCRSSLPELNEAIGANVAGINGPGLELGRRHATVGHRRGSVKWTVTIRPQPDRERLSFAHLAFLAPVGASESVKALLKDFRCLCQAKAAVLCKRQLLLKRWRRHTNNPHGCV